MKIKKIFFRRLRVSCRTAIWSIKSKRQILLFFSKKFKSSTLNQNNWSNSTKSRKKRAPILRKCQLANEKKEAFWLSLPYNSSTTTNKKHSMIFTLQLPRKKARSTSSSDKYLTLSSNSKVLRRATPPNYKPSNFSKTTIFKP